MPPWWESILGVKVKAVQENMILWKGLRHLGDSWNGGTTMEFLSPFVWRAPPLEMGRECPEFFPDKAAKEFLVSIYEAKTRLLWMWPGPSCFL